MRIVGGSLRGRSLHAPPGGTVRPTSDRVREALFNILEHADFGPGFTGLTGATVLDAFAGTGALGIEALSRGADHVSFFENSGSTRSRLGRSLADLGLTDRATLLTDATRPPTATRPVSLALLDPPYRRGLGPEALAALTKANWLAADAVVVLEQSETAAPELPSFQLLQARRYGGTTLVFLRWHGDRTAPVDPPLQHDR